MLKKEMYKPKNSKYLAQFRQGSGVLGMNAIDFYHDKEGNIIKYSWANGGGDMNIVGEVPEAIDGFFKLEVEND